MLKKLKIIIPALLLILFGLIRYFNTVPALDNVIYDNLLLSGREPSGRIVIIGMDERSINEIGQWPWPRLFVTDAAEKALDMGAAAVGALILYDAYGMSEENDLALVALAENTDRLVLGGMAFYPKTSQQAMFEAEDYILPFSELAKVVDVGFLNIEQDESDGVMRRALTSIRYGDITIHSLPYEVYKTYCRVTGTKESALPLDSYGQLPIDYVTGPGGFLKLSLWEVINDLVDPALFEGAIVLIGPYAQGIGTDDYPTPMNKSAKTYSVEINANIIQNMLEGNFKEDAPGWLDIALFAAFGVITVAVLNLLKSLWGALASVGIIVAQLAAAKIAFSRFDLIIKSGDGVIFVIVCFIAMFVLNILAMQNEKQHIQSLFGRFVAPEVVNEIISGNVEVQLGGTVKEISVLFVDIRGFTAFSEANSPEMVVAMVNRYLALTSRSIQENGGTIDKYIGDATMAVFNAPNDLPNHPLCAVRAAWAMKVGAEPLRDEIIETYGVDLQFGVGVNTGTAVVGNMGSDFRMEYTAIGDTVNTAARLEANAEKGRIIISDATYQKVKDYVEVTDLGVINVKNKKTGIQIYSLENVYDRPKSP
ncbi:MAG: adenylate/guanylate cyclase domain-containing protein [Oscillospiraceae bacterium]|nr:adenylate/guanylate cyclase domain-containing protein [Oscillospiraceae bacterium]